QLVRAGKVLYVGSSNFAAWHIVKANSAARERNLMGIVSEQSIYHLNNRMLELEVIPACRHYGLGLIPWSPLDGGLLGGALEKYNTGRRTGEDFVKQVEKNRDKLEK
ncbi:MAG TPA: aldo/keto reductase, partial [Chloroflexi bacterium]|nr:aldo/keto reductase [Chloroflexota bacterium]